MAGHSKWANIQHRKNAQDAKKGQLFTKLIREVTIAARMGGADPESNSRLRLALNKALAANMAKDNIQRAIQRGVGGHEGQQLEEIRYEGYGPNGAAIIVDAMTDNRNRTVSEIRHAFTKCGGNLGTEGSVSYLFTQKGQFVFEPGHSEEKILEVTLNAGAEDIQTHADGTIEVTTAPVDFESVQTALANAKLTPYHAEITWLAATEIALDHETAEKMSKLINILNELDDVQHVYTNAHEALE